MINPLLIQALQGCNKQGRPPVWLMRQAGRYMADYRLLRKNYSFMEMCRQPEIAAEVTMQPVKAFGPDAAIIFSDILVIAEALGRGLSFHEGKGPLIERPITNPSEAASLPSCDAAMESLGYVSEAITLLVSELKIPLLGFAGAPFTLAGYLIEGGSSGNLRKTKRWMLSDPISFHKLLDSLADLIAAHLRSQISAGAAAVQLFDSSAHLLSPPQFQACSLHYAKKIFDSLESAAPTIYFSRCSSIYAEAIAEALPSAAISLDWNSDLKKMRTLLGPRRSLQGNLDPHILDAPTATVKEETLNLLTAMGKDPAYIFNLGHGIMPETPVESVRALIETVKQWN